MHSFVHLSQAHVLAEQNMLSGRREIGALWWKRPRRMRCKRRVTQFRQFFHGRIGHEPDTAREPKTPRASGGCCSAEVQRELGSFEREVAGDLALQGRC